MSKTAIESIVTELCEQLQHDMDTYLDSIQEELSEEANDVVKDLCEIIVLNKKKILNKYNNKSDMNND